MTERYNISADPKRIQKIDDYVHKLKKNHRTSRSEFLIESAEMRIEAEKRKRRVK